MSMPKIVKPPKWPRTLDAEFLAECPNVGSMPLPLPTIKPFSLSRFATLFLCWDGHTEIAGDNSMYLFEPLDTNAPEDARPYIALGDYIDFYRRDGNEYVDRRVPFHQLQSASPMLVSLLEVWYEVASGKVVHHNGQWCMRWLCYRNTRAATMMNAGQKEF